MDSTQLFEKFVAFLQTPPALPDYLGTPPQEPTAFDPYQMVAEWVALRQELKQQGKLLQSAQQALKQALELAQSDNQELHQLRLQANQAQQTEREWETLWKDLLKVLDALDYACAHDQDSPLEASLDSEPKPLPEGELSGNLHFPLEILTPYLPANPQPTHSSPSIWRRLANLFEQLDLQFSRDFAGATESESAPINAVRPINAADQLPALQAACNQVLNTAVSEVVASHRQGLELIRQSLLGVLQQRKIIPIPVQGRPFDPQSMYAVGRQVTDEWPENTVYQEVLRGYRWGERILREAQVVVAVRRVG
jgi:molecular chaperone GrpE